MTVKFELHPQAMHARTETAVNDVTAVTPWLIKETDDSGTKTVLVTCCTSKYSDYVKGQAMYLKNCDSDSNYVEFIVRNIS